MDSVDPDPGGKTRQKLKVQTKCCLTKSHRYTKNVIWFLAVFYFPFLTCVHPDPSDPYWILLSGSELNLDRILDPD